jgi:hypothetical protein
MMMGTLLPVRSSPAKREAVLSGQHDVENDEIDLGAGQDLHHRAAIGGDRDAIAVLHEKVRQQGADLAVVVDDQEVWCHVHGAVQYRAPAAFCQSIDL